MQFGGVLPGGHGHDQPLLRRQPVRQRDERGVGGGQFTSQGRDVRQHLVRILAGQQRGGDLAGRLQPALPAAGLLEQAGVLDGHPGGGGQRLHDDLVVGGEVAAAAFLGQVQVAEHLVPDPHRHAQEGVHRGVVGREAVGVHVLADVVQPDRARVPDQGAEHAAPGRQVADPLPGGLVDARVDELLQHPVGSDHAERRVLRVGQPRGRLGDLPQRRRQLQSGPDRHDRLEQCVQPVPAAGDLGEPFLYLGEQFVQPQAGQCQPDWTGLVRTGSRYLVGHLPPAPPTTSPAHPSGEILARAAGTVGNTR